MRIAFGLLQIFIV